MYRVYSKPIGDASTICQARFHQRVYDNFSTHFEHTLMYFTAISILA
jgi:hypothetical protein